MKLQNKKTGEIGELLKHLSDDNRIEIITDNKLYVVESLAKLIEDWKDYEEPHTWYINDRGYVILNEAHFTSEGEKEVKSIGNYFEIEEEAEKAVEKLKAWKRLKDKGFKFTNWEYDITNQKYIITMEEKDFEELVVGRKKDDLDLLFSGGEE